MLKAARGSAFKRKATSSWRSMAGGRWPENGSHATRILRSYQPGEKIGLQVMRQRKEMKIEGTLPTLLSRAGIAFRAPFDDEA